MQVHFKKTVIITRYLVDFKPKHYESGSEDTFISFDGTEGVQVLSFIRFTNSTAILKLIMPIESDEKSSKNDSEYTLYKGSKKAIKGEKEVTIRYFRTQSRRE